MKFKIDDKVVLKNVEDAKGNIFEITECFSNKSGHYYKIIPIVPLFHKNKYISYLYVEEENLQKIYRRHK